ncbi:hypothetical protein [Thermobrachium celere]|uniref:Uncharacterized protein n=1 Tax=Thermobrachium celere DSM 8682 TaxID=941824 RepID=R7RUU5_9CLOT|nr:hypothetical protein [Thermobrachium celere]CDF59230.1 hypothetical protein TCEL_02298 [Thermobrachium celere DSM 8682]
MKNEINFEKASYIAKKILDVFYINGFHMELAKDKENYGCKRNERFTEHAIKTLNFALCISNLYYQKHPEKNTDDNIKKIVAGALFHDINKIPKYKKEKETDFELEDIEYILSDLGLYSEFKDCAEFILSSSIHKGRQQNTYKIGYALDENEEEMEIIRCADKLVIMDEIDDVIKKLKELFLFLNLNYKINYLKIKEIRPAITNIMLKALEQHIYDTNRRMFCYFKNYIIYLGEKIDLEKEIDEIVNKTLLIPTKETKYLDAVASNIRDNKYNFNFFDMFLILDTDNQLEILRKALTSKNDDILFRALKNRFEKVKNNLDKDLMEDTRFEIINNILNRKEDDIFIDLVRQIFISLNSYHTFLLNEKVEDVYEEVWNIFNQDILNLNEMDKKISSNINFMRNFKKVLDDGGNKIYYILISTYIADLILQRDDYKEIINKMKERFKESFEKSIQKFCINNNNVSLLRQDLKDYFYEVYGNKVNDTDYITSNDKIKSTCLICGRKIPEGLGFQKGFLTTKYSFKSKPEEIVINQKNGRLTKEIKQQPYLCKICAYDMLLQKINFDLSDTYLNPDIYVYTYKNIDFPISIDSFKKIKREIKDKIDEKTLYKTKFNNKSLFIKVEEKELQIEINKRELAEDFLKPEYRFNIFVATSSDAENVLKMYYQALVLSYYYGLNTVITSSKTLNFDNNDILFNGNYKNIYLNKVKVNNLTKIEDYKGLEESFYVLNSVFLIEDVYNGFKGQRSRELIPLITKMSVHPLGIFNYLRFKDSSERAAFFKAIYENKLNGPFINSLFKIANLNGGVQMTVCSEIAEKMLKFWKPNKSDSSYIITLPFRRSVKTIKEVKTNNIQEIKEIVCGSVRDLVERHNTVYSPTYGVDRINAIEQFVDVFIYGYYEGVCKCKKGELSKNENYFASAIEFLIIKKLYENDTKKEEEIKNE